MSIIIRPAQESDLAALAAVERACFPYPHWTEGDFRRYHCEVLEINHEVAGFVVFRDLVTNPQGLPVEQEILNLAVLPVYRRQGMGRKLLKAVLVPGALCFLEVRESNVGAQRLYRSLGFVEIGRRAKYYDNPEENAIVMKRE